MAVSLAERAAQQVGHAGDQLVEGERLGIERLAAREGEQTMGKRRGALGAAQPRLDGAPQLRRGFADPPLDGLEIALDDGQEIVEIVSDAAGQLTDRLHLLGLAQRFLDLHPGDDFRADALLQRLVEMMEILLDALARRDLVLAGLIEARVVDRHRGLRGDAGGQALGAFAEDAALGMAEEQPAEDLARACGHRHGKVAAHRQVARRHAMMRRRLSVARVGADIVGAHDPGAAEGRLEDRGVARYRKAGERVARHAGEGVEHIALALPVVRVVEERAELGTG